jgi:hypothetical protein
MTPTKTITSTSITWSYQRTSRTTFNLQFSDSSCSTGGKILYH